MKCCGTKRFRGESAHNAQLFGTDFRIFFSSSSSPQSNVPPSQTAGTRTRRRVPQMCADFSMSRGLARIRSDRRNNNREPVIPSFRRRRHAGKPRTHIFFVNIVLPLWFKQRRRFSTLYDIIIIIIIFVGITGSWIPYCYTGVLLNSSRSKKHNPQFRDKSIPNFFLNRYPFAVSALDIIDFRSMSLYRYT